MQQIRWGILGCGRIAGKFASDLPLTPASELVAVASRDPQKAGNFGKQYGARHFHGSYEALADNPEVDVIYIATPHVLHYENTLTCLEKGKAVLCEKPFAMNYRQAARMAEVARDKKLFLMEALWTRFMPHFRLVHSLVHRGELGQIRSLLVNFGFIPGTPVPDRLFNADLGGGTLLDIGIYNVFMALSILGRPDMVEASITRAHSGVDDQCAILFKYNNGAMAQLFSSFVSNLATEADINGDKARIRMTTRFYEPSSTIEFYPGRVDSRQILNVFKESGWGYQYEIRHVNDCLRLGLSESPVMGLDASLLLTETLDRVRLVAGLKYPADD